MNLVLSEGETSALSPRPLQFFVVILVLRLGGGTQLSLPFPKAHDAIVREHEEENRRVPGDMATGLGAFSVQVAGLCIQI